MSHFHFSPQLSVLWQGATLLGLANDMDTLLGVKTSELIDKFACQIPAASSLSLDSGAVVFTCHGQRSSDPTKAARLIFSARLSCSQGRNGQMCFGPALTTAPPATLPNGAAGQLLPFIGDQALLYLLGSFTGPEDASQLRDNVVTALRSAKIRAPSASCSLRYGALKSNGSTVTEATIAVFQSDGSVLSATALSAAFASFSRATLLNTLQYKLSIQPLILVSTSAVDMTQPSLFVTYALYVGAAGGLIALLLLIIIALSCWLHFTRRSNSRLRKSLRKTNTAAHKPDRQHHRHQQRHQQQLSSAVHPEPEPNLPTPRQRHLQSDPPPSQSIPLQTRHADEDAYPLQTFPPPIRYEPNGDLVDRSTRRY